MRAYMETKSKQMGHTIPSSVTSAHRLFSPNGNSLNPQKDSSTPIRGCDQHGETLSLMSESKLAQLPHGCLGKGFMIFSH